MGYKFQFITLAGFHALNYGMFELAHGYARRQMSAFVELQQKEFAAADLGFTAVKHQREVGTGYFRSEEHTSELQSLMRISYAVFCLKKKTQTTSYHRTLNIPKEYMIQTRK